MTRWKCRNSSMWNDSRFGQGRFDHNNNTKSRGNRMIDMAPLILRSRLQNGRHAGIAWYEVTWKSHDRHGSFNFEVTWHVKVKFEVSFTKRLQKFYGRYVCVWKKYLNFELKVYFNLYFTKLSFLFQWLEEGLLISYDEPRPSQEWVGQHGEIDDVFCTMSRGRR